MNHPPPVFPVPEHTPDIATLFAMQDRVPVRVAAGASEYPALPAMQTLWRAFFSSANVQIIQNAIRADVFRLSNQQYLIGPQRVDALRVIMNAFYAHQRGVRLADPTHVQITILNNQTIEYSVQTILTEAKAYITYLRSNNHVTIPPDNAPTLPSLSTRRTHQLPFGI